MENVKQQITDVLTDKLGVDEAEVLDDARLNEDLGADSLDAVEIIMEVEASCNVSISDDEGMGVKTVNDLVKLVESKQ